MFIFLTVFSLLTILQQITKNSIKEYLSDHTCLDENTLEIVYESAPYAFPLKKNPNETIGGLVVWFKKRNGFKSINGENCLKQEIEKFGLLYNILHFQKLLYFAKSLLESF